ncbi:DHHC palmitoyltransferase-domain-containing protein [Pholiota molesta]|nr:DHHC palmitoyltransferase-domain-containing protein [Pholiota molesta]
MSASPHSLTFSSSRNSLGSIQLPLPSGLNAPMTQRAPLIVAPSSPGPSSPRGFTSVARPPETYQGHSSTIQATFSPPNAPSTLPESMSAPPDDHFQLAPIATHYDSDDHHIAESIAGGNESEQEQQFMTLKRIKQSREPLLPGPHGLPPRPSMTASNSIPVSPASRMVRHSLDRVLSISRGLSFDSMRKSNSTRAATDENGYLPTNYNGPTDPELISAASPSPDPSFIPTPPRRRPPLSAVPFIDPATGQAVRKYQTHPSRNQFMCDGRMLTGGDQPWAFIASLGLLFAIAGVWFGTTAVWWWHNESPAVAAIGAYLALLTISTMFATATTDPGILPRNLDPDPPYPASSPSDGSNRAPMPRDLKVRTDVVRVKYCPTCRTYRPPRSSHCKMCDNCVDGCDHHCQWVNNCIGRRNYTTFFALLLSATTTLVLIIVTSALHLFFLTRREHVEFKHALGQGAGSAVAFCMSISVIWPVGALLSYHMRIRNQAHKTLVPGPAPPNPFSHGGWRRNLLAVLCRPQGYSWLDAAAIVTEDKRELPRGVSVLGHGSAEWEGERREED